MANGKVEIITQMMMDDSQFQSKAKSVDRMLKKLSTTQALFKLKIDDSDFRSKVREMVDEAQKQLRKAFSVKPGQDITYRNAKGNTIKIDTEASIKRATQYALEQSQNASLSAKDQKMWDSRRVALEAYTDAIQNFRTAVASAAREQRALESGRIASVRQQSTRAHNEEAAALRRVQQIERQIARERLNNSRYGGDSIGYIRKEIDLYHQLEVAAKQANDAKSASYARNQITALNKQADAVEKVNTLFGRQGKILSGLKGLATRYFSIYTVARFGEKVAETTGYFQQQQVALEGILGSASKANSVLNEIKSFALQSPFQTKDLVTFTKQLGAFGVGNNDLFPTVKKLADISAGLGVDMNRIILAYGQVKSAAVLRGQELRQFTEAGIPMVQALADKFSVLNGKMVTTGEVFKLISERKVPFEMVAEVLSDMTAEGGKFYKMQENITNTTYGQIQKLKDLWTLAMDDLGKDSKGFINGIIKGLQSVVKHIKPIAGALASAFLFNGLGRIVKTVYQLTRAFKSAATAARIFGTSLVSSVSGGIGLVLGAIAGLVINARSKANELQRKMDEVSRSFDRDTAKMVTGLDSLSKKIGSSGVGTKQYNDAVSALVSNYGKFLSNDMVEALQSQGTAAEQAAAKFMTLVESIKEAIRQQQEWNKLKAQAEAAGGQAGEKGSSSASERSGGLFDAKTDIFSIAVYDGGQSSREQTFAGITQFLKDNEGISRDDLRSSIASMYGEILQEAAEEGMEFDDSKTALKESIVSRIAATYDIDEETLKKVAERIIETTSKSAIDAFNEAAKKYSLAGATIFAQMMKPFDDLDKTLSSGTFMEGSHQIDKDVARYNLAFSALSDAFWTVDEKGNRKARFEGYEGSDLQKLIDSNEHNAIAAYNVVQEIEKFSKGKGTDIVAKLSLLSDRFTKYADVRSTHSARVTGAFRDNGALYGWRNDKALKNIVSTYGSPTDKNFWQLRDQLQEEHAKTLKEIARVEALPNVKNFSEYLSELKKQRDAMKTLMSDAYYGTGEKKTGGEYDIEISELVSNMKEAYEVYKKATQAEGADMGLAYMKNDPKMKERFADYFHGFAENLFKNEKGEDIKIGKSGQTIRSLLEDTFIEGGIEKGVIDFEKAIRKVGQAMIDYGKQNEKARKGFISAGKAYIKYADQISKDNVAAWIAEINKQFQDLGKTFERTNQQVELYRQLMRNGTAGQLGQYAASSRGAVLTPGSDRNLANIRDMAALYNKKVLEMAMKGLKEGEALDESKLSYINIGNLNSVQDILSTIDEVTQRMKLNSDNFGLDKYGEGGSKMIANLLEKQLGIVIEELKGIQGEFTGKALADAVANAQRRVAGSRAVLDEKEMTAMKYGQFNGDALSAHYSDLQKEVQAIYDNFVKSNDFAAMSKATSMFGGIPIDLEKMKGQLQKIINSLIEKGATDLANELQKKMKDLEIKVKDVNAKMGTGFPAAVRDFFNADTKANEDWKKEYFKNYELGKKAETLSGRRDVLKKTVDTGVNEFGDVLDEDELEFYKRELQAVNEEIVQNNLDLAASNATLEQMGEHGEKLKNELREAAAADMKASLEANLQDFNTLSSAVTGVVGAFKALAKAISMAWDIMNDGANPKELQLMEGFIEDFGNAFETLVAPIAAAMAMVIALTAVVAILGATAGAVFGALIAAAAIFAGILAIFQLHDKKLQMQIEELESHITDTENEMKNLNAAAQRMSGYRQFNTEIQSLSKNLDIYKDKLKQAQLEEDKKNTDDDKVKEYKQGAQEALDEFLNSLKDATDEITGSVTDWASSLSEALRSAFQNGENAARAFRNTAIEMVGDIVNKIIEMTVLEPMMEQAINGLLGYSLDENSSNYIGAQDKFKNEDGSVNSQKLADYVTGKLSNDNAAGIIQFMETVQGGYANVIDFINNELAQPLKEAWAYNSDTSELSGGIQGITEDTARTLEGLANSQLAQLVLIQRSVLNIESSGIAQVQTSWFNDMLNQQRAIRVATEGVKTALDEMRNGIRPMSVTMQ